MSDGLIYQAIPKIMDGVGSIGKDRKNPQQGYSFRGIDDLYNAVQGSLIEHGVFSVPKVIDMKREERQNKNGGLLMYTILTIQYTFYAKDGSSFEAITVGEAMDSGDKSCNKAMSAAQKYAFLQIFSIPTDEPKDTENETHEITEKKYLTFKELLDRIDACKAIPELTNVTNKYKADFDKMSKADQDSIKEAKANKKKLLQEGNNA